MQENVLLRRGADGRAHIPPMPFWLGIVRIAQLVCVSASTFKLWANNNQVLTLVIMILAAYSSSVFGAGYVSIFVLQVALSYVLTYPQFVGYGLSFFLFFWTILFLAYIIIAPLFIPKIYVYWVQLLLEFKTTIFWLATFALLAEEAAAWGSVEGLLNTPVVDAQGNTTYTDYWPGWKGAIDATKAAAGLGALTWLLFVVSLITFGEYAQGDANKANTLICSNRMLQALQGKGPYALQLYGSSCNEWCRKGRSNRRPAASGVE